MGSEITDILSGFRDNVTVQWFLATRQQWLEPRSVYSVEYLIPSINTPESLLSLLGAAEMYIQRPHHCTASSSQAGLLLQSHLRGFSFLSLKLCPLTSRCVHPKIFLSTAIHCRFKCSNTAFHRGPCVSLNGHIHYLKISYTKNKTTGLLRLSSFDLGI